MEAEPATQAPTLPTGEDQQDNLELHIWGRSSPGEFLIQVSSIFLSLSELTHNLGSNVFHISGQNFLEARRTEAGTSSQSIISLSY
jgi:hypothetical protein